MDQYYINESKLFYFDKTSETSDNLCELNINFPKSIQLKRQMECCLCDLILPSDMKTNLNQKPTNDLELSFHLYYISWTQIELLREDEQVLKEAKNAPFLVTRDVEFKYKIELDEFYSKKTVVDKIKEKIPLAMQEMGKHFNEKYPGGFVDGNFDLTKIGFDPMHLEFKEKELIMIPGAINIRYKVMDPEDSDQELDFDEIDKNMIEYRTTCVFWVVFEKNLHEFLHIKYDYPIIKREWGYGYDRFSHVNTIYDYKIIPNEKLDIVYIYTDIVKESFVGNQKVNILRIVPIINKKTYYVFPNLNFIPLRIDNFDSVRIMFRNHVGEKIYFDKGYLSCTVLIRPIEHI